MAKKLPRSIAQRGIEPVPDDDELLARARNAHASRDDVAGGAWATAGNAALSAELQRRQDELLRALLSGNLVFDLDPSQIDDDVGSDRIGDWIEDEAFGALKTSIQLNGQDTPIQVTPAKADWRPAFDTANSPVTDGYRFRIVSGRRRLEALRQLDGRIRAICVAPRKDEDEFDLLHRRYRENAEREDLSCYEDYVAIGELFETALASEPKLKARAFAAKINVSEVKISKSRAVYAHRHRIAEEFEDPNILTLHDLDAILPALKAGEPLPSQGKKGATQPAVAKPPPAPVLKRTQIIKGQKFVAKVRNGKLSIDLGSMPDVDGEFLDRLLLFIAQPRS